MITHNGSFTAFNLNQSAEKLSHVEIITAAATNSILIQLGQCDGGIGAGENCSGRGHRCQGFQDRGSRGQQTITLTNSNYATIDNQGGETTIINGGGQQTGSTSGSTSWDTRLRRR